MWDVGNIYWSVGDNIRVQRSWTGTCGNRTWPTVVVNNKMAECDTAFNLVKKPHTTSSVWAHFALKGDEKGLPIPDEVEKPVCRTARKLCLPSAPTRQIVFPPRRSSRDLRWTFTMDNIVCGVDRKRTSNMESTNSHNGCNRVNYGVCILREIENGDVCDSTV